MAEFYLVLKKAVGGLHPNTTESRRGVYEKARNALVAQLKGISPPLSNAEISRRRLEMEEAIRRVERENAEALQANFPENEPAGPVDPPRSERSGDDGGDWPPPPAPASRDSDWPPPSGATPRRGASEAPARYQARQAEYLEAAPPRAPRRDSISDRSDLPASGRGALDDLDSDRRSQQAFEWSASERRDFEGRDAAPERGGQSSTRRRGSADAEARRSGPPPDEEDYDIRSEPRGTGKRAERARDTGKSRLPSLILLGVGLAFAILVAFVGFQNRDAIARIIKNPRDIVKVVRDVVSPSTTPTRPAAPAAGSAAPQTAAKVDGQLAQATPVRQIRSAGEAEAPGAGSPIATPVPPAPNNAGVGPATAPQVATAPSAPLPPPVTQKVTFIEESATTPGQISATLSGTVVWSLVEGGPDGMAVQGKITVPDRKLELTMLIHKNSDATASHQIDINATIGVGSSIGAIDLIPTMVFKTNDKDGGTKPVGKAIKLIEACASQTAATPKCRDVNNKPAAAAPGVYWITLSPVKADVATNIGLLRDKPLVDLPIAYKTGQRAIITIEKGGPASPLFTRAIASWGN